MGNHKERKVERHSHPKKETSIVKQGLRQESAGLEFVDGLTGTSHNFTFFRAEGNHKILTHALTAALWLREHMFEFQYLRYVATGNYVYTSQGYFQCMAPSEFKHYIYVWFSKRGITALLPEISKLVGQLQIIAYVDISDVQRKDYIGFQNGVLERTSGNFVSHSPSRFVTGLLPFDYDPSQQLCPRFHQFLEDFTLGREDHKLWIRNWLTTVIHGDISNQVFVFILGPSGSGKSVLERVTMAMVGGENTLATSLKDINTDKFELTNVIGKTLLLLSDTDKYKGDLAVLRQLTGGDLIHSHIKFRQGTVQFFNAATIVIVGNALFSCQDFSGALERRIRIIPGDSPVKPENRVRLLESNRGQWIGGLASELPAIFNWAWQIPLEDALQHTLLNNLVTDQLEGLNSIRDWAKVALKPGGQAVKNRVHVGAKFGLGDQKAYYEAQRRNAMYPHYLRFCDRHGLPVETVKDFKKGLIAAASSIWPDKAQSFYGRHDTKGSYVNGLEFQDDAWPGFKQP